MPKLIKTLCAVILLTSCSNDELLTAPTDCTQSVSVVQVPGDEINSRSSNTTTNALSFANEESLNEFKQELQSLSEEERQNRLHSYGVSTLYDLAEIADEELEDIGAKATSETEFRKMYDEYVKKYEGLLVRNVDDELDLQLYVPDKDNIMSYIVNSQNKYVVDKQIKQAELNMIYHGTQQTNALASTSDDEEKQIEFTNSGDFEPAGSKRVTFSIGRKYDTVHITAKFEKHMWYGWKHDKHHEIMFDLALKGAKIKWIAPPANRIRILTEKNFDKDMFQITDNGTLEGNIYIWTDYSYERDKNSNIIMDGAFPKVLLSKAVICRVSLPRKI